MDEVAFKIVEVVDDGIRTLFHGLNGSRRMPRGIWLRADERQVKDGTSNTSYMSGWHVFLSRLDCHYTSVNLLNAASCSK